ncbi:hypothetical protein BKA67DRAFT_553490 [Truncatella angustata]|uniref:Uncharacterized protein n=1 Tax=Truncatella angustata TaxID=152316 RepID=A0A9P8ZZ64_9PEZI|nr:uncharacterized protein BKA67DRAFT_553490 [Truncatella angustata]KAH6656882.1 hypothetical protein BKA67DRAFT_553490 [Truncatella angustata]
MESLPSYEQATTAPHWLQLVGPYVLTTDWRRCSRVNKLFYQQFAPRLWLDPLVTARHHGLHPNDDLAWYCRFVYVHLNSVRLMTREFVRSLDFRNFAVVASGLYSTDASERAISNSFKHLPTLFPRLVCLLVDGHPELNPESLAWVDVINTDRKTPNSLQLLDLANCPHHLNANFFRSAYLRDLVYLDISSLPGSISQTVKASLNPDHVPGLRVLKIRQRELDDSSARILLQRFGRQLWSLDLSNNKLTDATIDTLIRMSFSSLTLRSDAHFHIEGKLISPGRLGTIEYGPLEFLMESKESSTFVHPMRYFPDAPPYICGRSHQELQEWQTVRCSGAGPRRCDDIDSVKSHLLADLLGQQPVSTSSLTHDARSGQGGLTHLSISGNQITSAGVRRLLRCTLGRLEHFDCSVQHISSITSNAQSSLRISGLFGTSHLIRPVFSSNLRHLRVHHSLVTNIPTVNSRELSQRAAAVFAETVVREHAQIAYPQVFVPDTNPRLSSLTLTHIPTHSIGPLILALTNFLDLASSQQHAVEKVLASSTQRGSKVVRGLQYIRLELLSDEELPTALFDDDVDFDQLLDPASFTNDNLDETSGDAQAGLLAENAENQIGRETQVIGSPKMSETAGNSQSDIWQHSGDVFIVHRVEAPESWTGNVFTLKVWTGSEVTGMSPAVSKYTANVQDPKLRKNVGPAMPHHVAAGVPYGSYIFYTAWDEMIFPGGNAKPNLQPLLALHKDVAVAIKEYRAQTRGTDRYWKGKLELVRDKR